MRKHSLIGCLLLCSAMIPLTAHAATPAERAIDEAESVLVKKPRHTAAHAHLAMALARRARETGEPRYYDEAMASVKRALAIAPEDFVSLRTEVWILLGKHEFAAARSAAEALNKRAPDDLLTYAMLVDAYIELGEYAKAEEAAQWLLDIRPGNVAGLTRAAYLRELFGDIDGAIDLMAQAVVATPKHETEERAWILTQLAKLHLHRGEAVIAVQVLDEALSLFPDYHYAIAALADARLATGELEQSVALSRQHVALAPHPENRYALAKRLHYSGKLDEAEKQFAIFAKAARAESTNADNANRELINYLANHGETSEALALAKQEISRRRDVATLDAYAWALHQNGNSHEAQNIVEQALRVGVRDAKTLYHAGFIAAATGDPSAAKHLEAAIKIAPWSSFASAARAELVTETLTNTPSIGSVANVAP